MDYKDSKIDTLLISESNYSCQLFDESFIKMKNDKNKQIYQLDEKEKDIYEQQEELGRKMLDLISNNQKEFKHKYNQLQKEEDLYHREYNNFNSRISNLLNQYNNYYNQNNYYYNDYNSNFINLNSLFEALDNKWIFPKKEPVNNNKSFRSKFNIKSCEKKIIKKDLNNKSYIRSKSKTYRKSTNNYMNNLKIKNNNNEDKNKDKDNIIKKTERKKKYDFNFNKNNQRNKNDKNDKIRAKSRTTRTNTRNSYTSFFEENKISNDKKPEFNNYFENKDYKNNKDDQILIKPDYSKYLTREYFYPKSFRIENNKERLTSDEIFYETKTSFRDNRMKKDLYEKAFKKCNYKSNIYNSNDK